MMNQEREGRILEAAVEKYGSGLQTDMMIEEMSELTKALCKYRRGHCVGMPASGNPSEDELLASVLEEMADVQIMLNQMVLIYGDPTEHEIAKLERLAERCGVAEDG